MIGETSKLSDPLRSSVRLVTETTLRLDYRGHQVECLSLSPFSEHSRSLSLPAMFQAQALDVADWVRRGHLTEAEPIRFSLPGVWN